MVLPTVALLSYWLCLSVERALVGLSPLDAESLRSRHGLPARRVLALYTSLRSVLAALLLARVLLLILAAVGLWAAVGQSGWAQAIVEGELAPVWLAETAIFGPAAFGLAALAWALAKLPFPFAPKSPLWLKGLWWFAHFWHWAFKPFTKSEGGGSPTDGGHAEAEPLAAGSPSEKREMELLKSIVQFGDVTVKQVMQPRSRVVYVDFRASFHELLDVVRQSEFSRLPVCDEDLDNVTGILYVKDLVPYLDEGDSFEWQKLIRTNVLMVPEAKPGSELLREFKEQRMHMAFVVDEYGGVEGIVTMEDILEEVTGDIRDEFDEESEIRYRKLDEHTYLFEGQTLLNDVCRVTGVPPSVFEAVRGNADTLAGLALELRGDIPLPGTELAWAGYGLTVTRANKRMVQQVKFSIPRPEQA